MNVREPEVFVTTGATRARLWARFLGCSASRDIRWYRCLSEMLSRGVFFFDPRAEMAGGLDYLVREVQSV